MLLVIATSGGRRTLFAPDDCTIDYLNDSVCQMMTMTDIDTLYLCYQGRMLENNCDQKVLTAKDYNIVNMSTITVAVRVNGGGGWLSTTAASDLLESASVVPEKATQPTDIALPATNGEVKQTQEACSICFDNGPNDYRAKMLCGHVICSEDMRNFCTSSLNSGLFCFKCPHCHQDWAYAHIRQVSSLSDEDAVKNGEKLNANFLRYGKAMQQCPTCHNYCLRELNTWVGAKNFVVCPVCTNRLGKKTSFCWSCKREWRGGIGKLCGNEGCDGVDSRVSELAKCGTKEISNSPGCPLMRGCERCGALIVHQDNCKHITCHSCQYTFCFVCLKTPTNGVWPCGPAYSACDEVAPRQTSIPG